MIFITLSRNSLILSEKWHRYISAGDELLNRLYYTWNLIRSRFVTRPE